MSNYTYLLAAPLISWYHDLQLPDVAFYADTSLAGPLCGPHPWQLLTGSPGFLFVAINRQHVHFT